MAFGFNIPPMGSQDAAFGLTPDMLASLQQAAGAAQVAPGPAAAQPAPAAPFGLAGAAQSPADAGAAAPPAPAGGASATLPMLSVGPAQQSAGAGSGPAAAPAPSGNGPMTDQQALIASAQRLGLSPVEWGGIIHYESGGDPSRWGGTGGRHVGLIQFGPSEQKQFGVTGRESFQEQLLKAEQFMSSRGYTPGMGVMNAYSTINAGSPGRFNASDANNGGMPGTVADKVNNQFAPHYAWANKFLGGGMQLPNAAGGSSAPAAFGLSGPTQGRGAGTVMPSSGGPMELPSSGGASDAATPGVSSNGIIGALEGAAQGAGKNGQKQSGGASPMQFRTVRPKPFGFLAPMQFAGQNRGQS